MGSAALEDDLTEETELPSSRAADALANSGEIELYETDLAVISNDSAPMPTDATVILRLPKTGVLGLLRRVAEATGLHRLPEPVKVSPRERARDWRSLRTAPFFDGLPNEALRDGLMKTEVRVLRLGRDRLLPTDGALALVLGGQLAVGQFAPEVLASERRIAAERAPSSSQRDKKRAERRRLDEGPLVQRADRSLGTFEQGDVLETALGGHERLSLYTVTPAEVVLVARSRADLWRRIYPFMADRFRRAAAAARARLSATDGSRALVADFFIRHGLSVSTTLRVRRIDACIECGACTDACEERYGAPRLALHGRVLGGLDFVDACHTCTDQRCIDPCNFDAIRFDADRGEVVINEAACTGCTLCASACPYDAIEMHALDDTPLLKLRLQRSGALAFGDGAARKAQLRRMASKCDHCMSYADQACITACPTGALVEVAPSDVIGQLSDEARATARAGYDRTSAIDVAALNHAAFTAVPNRARTPRVKLYMALWWGLGLGALFVAAAEVLLRSVWPTASVTFWVLTTLEGLDAELARGQVVFRPGSGLAVAFGWIGTGLMFSGMGYVWRRRFAFLRHAGPLRAWLDWHVMTGVVGPGFVLLHSAGRLDNWVSLGFWSMILTVASGLVGRYLSTEIPERASTAAVEILEEDRRLARLRAEHAVPSVDLYIEAAQRRMETFARRMRRLGRLAASLQTLWWVLRDDLAGFARRRAVWRSLRGLKVPQRREALGCARRVVTLGRRQALLPFLLPLFSHWKAVHIPMAVLLTLIGGLHIVLALRG